MRWKGLYTSIYLYIINTIFGGFRRKKCCKHHYITFVTRSFTNTTFLKFMRKSHHLIFVNMLTNTSPLIHIQFLSCHTATGISLACSILGAVLAAWIRGTFVDVWNCQIQMGLVLFQNVYRTVKSYKYSINNTDLWNWAMGSFSFQFC